MALKLEIFAASAGAWQDVTPFLANQSLTVKLNSLDFTLIDPTGTVLTDAIGGLTNLLLSSAALSTLNASGEPRVRLNTGWAGILASVQGRDMVDRASGHYAFVLTAVNSVTAIDATQSMVLTDTPVALLDDYLLEDGSGHYMLEAATWSDPGALQLEGGSYGYSGLSLTSQANTDGTSLTTGQLTMYQPGLWPGTAFTLTSTNLGIPGASYRATQVVISFPTPSPVFSVTFGKLQADTPQTWAQFIGTH